MRSSAIIIGIYSNASFQWRSGSWQQEIADDKYDGETGMHSVQNGNLLDSTAHIYFDKYLLAINPDVCISQIFLFTWCF